MSFGLVPYFLLAVSESSFSSRLKSQDMKKSFGACFIAMLISMLIISCGNEADNEPRTVVDSFACAYFNWRFKEAMPYVTFQSREWLRFAASQVDSDVIDSLRAMEFAASVEVVDIDVIGDSTALANILVKDFLVLDSIGKQPHKEAERNFKIPVSLEGNHWRVKLTHMLP